MFLKIVDFMISIKYELTRNEKLTIWSPLIIDISRAFDSLRVDLYIFICGANTTHLMKFIVI